MIRQKNEIRIVLCMMLCLMILSGCNKTDLRETAETSQSAVESSTESVTDTEKTDQQTISEKRSRMFSQLYKKSGAQGIYTLPVSLDSEEYVLHMEVENDQLLIISTGAGNLHLQIFNLSAGEITTETQLELNADDMADGGYLPDGGVWVYTSSDLQVRYYDSRLNYVKTESIPQEDGFFWSTDYENDVLWILNSEEYQVSYYDIPLHKYGEYQLDELLDDNAEAENVWMDTWKATQRQMFLTVTYAGMNNIECYSIHEETGEITPEAFLSSTSISYNSHGGSYYFCDEYRIMDYKKRDELLFLKNGEGTGNIIDYQNGFLFCEDGNQIGFYECQNGKAYKPYELYDNSEEGSWAQVIMIASQQEYPEFVLAIEEMDQISLVLCNMNEIPVTDQVAVYKKTETDIRQEIQAYEKTFEGNEIDVLTAEEVEKEPDSSGYFLMENTSILDKWDAYCVLGDFLDSLPEGMMEEILEGANCRMEWYFSGSIRGNLDDGNLSNAGGYVNQRYDEKTDDCITRVVLDTSLKNVLQTNIAHEFYHIMEECLYESEAAYYEKDSSIAEKTKAWDSKNNNKKENIIVNWETQWDNLSPEDGYFYDYNEMAYYNETGGMDYVSSYEPQDWAEVYFIDSYSRTYPKEDRARIFEYLYMAGTGQELPECFGSKHIQKKAEYLCALIRACYPSVEQEKDVIWEKAVKN